MHELAVCQALIREVESIARQRSAHSVEAIVVKLGPLSGVEPQLLQQAYPFARAGTVAETAELVIEQLPVKVRCDRCGRESDAAANRLLCAHCGDWHTQVTSGDELLLASVSLIDHTTH